MTTALPNGLSGALLRYRVMAYLTGVLLGFMTVVGLPYKYLYGGDAAWYGVGWMLHGWAYIGYVAVALDLVFRMRWALPRALAVVLAGTIPFMSFVAERKVTTIVASQFTPLSAAASSEQAATPNG